MSRSVHSNNKIENNVHNRINSFSGVLLTSGFMLVFLGTLLFLFALYPKYYILLTREDALFESLTAVFYFAAGIIFLFRGILLFKRKRRIQQSLFPLLFGLLFLFIFFEETSWCSRIFNFSSPEIIKQINEQQEINLHNLKLFSGKHSMFSFKRYFNPNTILSMLGLFLGALLPLFAFFAVRVRKIANKIHFPVIPVAFIPIFVFGFFYAFILSRLFGENTHHEIKEFMFAFGFFLFSLSFLFNKINLPGEK